MAKAICIIGESGAGKTTSLRNLDPKETYYIDADKKGSAWRGFRQQYNAANKNYIATDDPNKVLALMKGISEKSSLKYIVVDTLNGIMIGEEMRRSKEKNINKQIFNGDSSLNLRSEYRRRSKGFIFKIKVPINELTFDGCGYENEYNVEYNTEEIYKCVGSYLVNQVLHRGISNRVIRLRDNAKVDADNILEIIEVSDEDLYRY